MKELALKFWRAQAIPKGVRILTIATSIRWIGWGFAETLIPVFLFSFATGYAEAGLIKASYDIAFIIALPIIGVLADKMRGTTLILVGLSLYIIVGAGYLMAGLTGMVIWIIIARFLNGVGYGLDSVGRVTYFRRHVPQRTIATVFGYFDTVADFWWIAAAIAGIFLVKFIPIHWLLFLITPTVIISMIVVWRFRRREREEVFSLRQKTIRYRDLLKEVVMWDWKLKMIITLNFFLSSAYAVVVFFLPIQLFIEGAGYTPIIIMGVVMTIPTLFGFVLGNVFDRQGKRVFIYGIALFGVLIGLLGFTIGYGWQIVIAFCIGVVIELLSIGSSELITAYSNPEHFGRVDGLMRSITTLGAMVGPLAAGVAIDVWGNRAAYWVLGLLVLSLALGFAITGGLLEKEERV